MKAPLIVAAIVEIATGLALLIGPALVAQLLLGSELIGVAIPVTHVLGIALVSLGVACWPGTPRVGMLIYGAGVTLYLGYLGIGGHWAGPVLWPVVAGHALLTLLLARAWLTDSQGKDGGEKGIKS